MSKLEQIYQKLEKYQEELEQSIASIQDNKEKAAKTRDFISQVVYGISPLLHVNHDHPHGMYSEDTVEVSVWIQGPRAVKGEREDPKFLPGCKWSIDFTGSNPPPKVTADDIISRVNEGLEKLGFQGIV